MKKKVKGECFPGIRFLLLCAVMLAGLGLLLLPQAASAAEVQFSIPEGHYDEPQTVVLTCDEGWKVCYTTDGTSPIIQRKEYGENYPWPNFIGNDNPVIISVDHTTLIRAVAYAFGANPYFVDVSGKYGGVNDHIAYTIILQNLIPSEEDYHDPVRRMAVNILAYALGGKNDVSWQEFTAFFLQDFALYEIEQTILESGGPISLANDLLELCNTRDETAALITDTISITQDMGEDEFAEYLHNNVPRFTKIAKATGHVIENFADLPEALQIILEYSGAAWSVGEIIGCAMDLCQTTGSVFKIVDAIWDAHKPASYVRFINATFYGYNGLSGTDVSSAAASVYTSEITTIGKNCFADCKSLTSVDLKNVKYISTNAFLRCSSLPNLEIPDTVEAIGKYAFAGLTSLKNLKLPVEYFINQDVFYYDDGHGPWTVPNLEQVTVTAGSTGRMADLDKSSNTSKTIPGMSAAALTSVILEEGVTSIGDYAFYDYHKNSGNVDSFTISLPSTLTSIGKLAFYRHKLTGELVLPEGLTSLGSSAFQEAVGITGIIIPSSLREIPSLAFFSASGVSSLIIPDTVETIGSGAFAGMYNLISLTLPVEHFLSTNAFYYDNGDILGTVPNLEQVTVTAGSTGKMADLDKSSNTSKTIPGMSAAALTSVILEEGVTSIGDYAFYDYHKNSGNAESFTISLPSTLTSIGKLAFYRHKLTGELVLPEGLTSLGSSAFQEAVGITGIIIPSTLSEIPSLAFFSASGVPSLIIPDTVETIGSSAFAGMYNLISLTLPVEHFLSTNAFYYDNGDILGTVPNLEQVTVTAGSTGRMADLDKSSNTSKTIPGMSAAALTSVILEEGVTSIGDYAFYDYHKNSGNVESFTISLPSTLTSIGKLAFYRHKLTGELVLPEGLTSLGSSAFQEAVGITGIIIPSTLSEIPSLAFFSANGVSSLIIPDTVETIGSGAFAGMYNLISLTLPVEHFLSTNAFYYNNGAISGTVSNLEQVTVTAGSTGRMADLTSSSSVNKTIAGMNAAALTSVVLEEGITNIGKYAFYYYQQSGSVCCGIDVTIPKTVSSIGSYAFRNRVFSVSPLIPPFVETIGSGAFEGIGVPVIVYPYSTALDYVTSNNISYTLAACKIYSFPDMLTNIESEALMNTPAEIIILPNTNISIGERAFSNSNIYAVVVTGDIISAEVNAFEGCGKIIFIADADSNAAVWAEANGYTVKQAD